MIGVGRRAREPYRLGHSVGCRPAGFAPLEPIAEAGPRRHATHAAGGPQRAGEARLGRLTPQLPEAPFGDLLHVLAELIHGNHPRRLAP